MNKISKNLLVLFLAILLGSCFSIFSAQAQNDELILEVTKECNIKYTGDSCVAELKITNNIGKVLDGEVFLHIDYKGICGDGSFDGEGIEARFSIIDNNWLNFSGWENGTTAVLGFEIAKGETQQKLKIETVSNLCPGEYTFNLKLKGTTEKEEYITPPVVLAVIGGGGGYYAPPITSITNTGKVTATPGEGGITTLTNPDGSKVELTIPSGTVSKNTNFTISTGDINSVNQPDPASGLFLIAGLVFEIKAERNGEFITTFDKPLTLTFTYTDEKIKGLDENSLKTYWWDKTLNQWVVLENSEVDIDNNTVTASIDHFTIFALMGSKIGFAEEEAKKEEKPTEEIGIPEIIKEGIKKIIEGITPSVPSGEAEKPSALEEGAAPSGETVPPTETSQRGLALMVAAIGMTWGEISNSTFLTIVVILCLTGLVLIGIREWRLFRKKRKIK